MRDHKTGRFMPKVTNQPSKEPGIEIYADTIPVYTIRTHRTYTWLCDLCIGILVIGGTIAGVVTLITQARL